MSNETLYDRQAVRTIFMDVGLDYIGSANALTADLPPGSLVVGVSAITTVAFDTAGDTPTAKLTVTDGTTVLVNAQSVASTGRPTVAFASAYYPAGGTISVYVEEGVASGDVTTATEGAVVIAVQYVQRGVGGTIYG